MADGRLFTDYRPRCDANLQYKAAMSGSYDYRQFLIANGASIIEGDRRAASDAARCSPCMSPYEVGTMAPEADRVVCDKVSCARVRQTMPPGVAPGVAIGTGRAYTTAGSSGPTEAAEAFQRARQADQASLMQQQQGTWNPSVSSGGASAFSQSGASLPSALPGGTAIAQGPPRW